MRIEINYEKCNEADSKCGVQCMDACSVQGALSGKPPVAGIIAIEPTCCNNCGNCVSVCPENAISISN